MGKRKQPDYCSTATTHFFRFLDHHDKRTALRDLGPGQARLDPVFTEVREIGHRFQERLTRLFFRDTPEMYKLTEFYGVF